MSIKLLSTCCPAKGIIFTSILVYFLNSWSSSNLLITALLVTSDWSALQTDALLTYTADPEKMAISEIVAPVLIVYPILLLVLSKKYGWTNWKDKLFGNVEEPPKEDYKVLD